MKNDKSGISLFMHKGQYRVFDAYLEDLAESGNHHDGRRVRPGYDRKDQPGA
jgi:hypothetical protein